MSQFLNHIINRHQSTENTIKPRPRGLFEPQQNWQTITPNSFSPEPDIPEAPKTEATPSILSTDPIKKTNHIQLKHSESKSEIPKATQGIQSANRSEKVLPKIKNTVTDLTLTTPNKMISKETSKENYREQPELSQDLQPPFLTNTPPLKVAATDHTFPFQFTSRLDLNRSVRNPSPNLSPIQKDDLQDLPEPSVPESNFPERHPVMMNLTSNIQTLKQQLIIKKSKQVLKEESESTVKIHIGRIEIKAVKSLPKREKKIPLAKKARMSLDKYLKEKDSK